eukprot:m.286265 g.286265  ORF g.286265 m.286265 type:complete len:331 (-) comp11540_c0_seq1:345-1337(-)
MPSKSLLRAHTVGTLSLPSMPSPPLRRSRSMLSVLQRRLSRVRVDPFGLSSSDSEDESLLNDGALDIAPDVAKSLGRAHSVASIVTVRLPRHPTDGFGVLFVGPRTQSSDCNGIFVSFINPKSVAGQTPELRIAQRVLQANDIDVSEFTKQEMVELVHDSEDTLEMRLVFDPQGYSLYDGGDALRQIRISALVSAGSNQQHLPVKARYLGAVTVNRFDAFELQEAYQQVKANKETAVKLDLALGKTNIVSSPRKFGIESLSQGNTLSLVDVAECVDAGPTIAIIMRGRRSSLRVHFYRLGSSKESRLFASAVNFRCREAHAKAMEMLEAH